MSNVLKADLGELFRRKAKGAGADSGPTTAREFVPTLPQVNLLPSSVRESIRIARVGRGAAWGVVAVAALTAGLWLVQANAIQQAEQQLNDLQAENVRLSNRANALAPIEQMATQLERQQELVTTALADQPQAAPVLRRLEQAAQAAGAQGIEFTTVQVTYHGIPKAGDMLNPCPNPDPFTSRVTVGCVSYSATARNREQITSFLRATEADAWFVGSYIGTSTLGTQTDTGTSTVTFSGTAGLSHEALVTPLTEEQVEALERPPAPSPSATAGS